MACAAADANEKEASAAFSHRCEQLSNSLDGICINALENFEGFVKVMGRKARRCPVPSARAFPDLTGWVRELIALHRQNQLHRLRQIPDHPVRPYILPGEFGADVAFPRADEN